MTIRLTQLLFPVLMSIVALCHAAYSAEFLIEDFGAIAGDGIDDAAAINAAIAAAGPGDTVRLGPGVYHQASAIVPKSNMLLIGAGRESTTLVPINSTPIDGMIQLGSRFVLRDNVEIAGFTLNANMNPKIALGINGGNGNGAYIHDMGFENLYADPDAGAHGIYFWLGGQENVRITNNVFSNMAVDSNWGASIRLNGANNFAVSNNVMTDMGRGGVLATRSTNLVITNNTILGTGRTGRGLSIELHQDNDRNLVEDNTVDHFISIAGSSNTAVRRNHITTDDGTYEGYAIEAVAMENNVFTDNYAGPGNYMAVVTGLSNHSLFAHNTFANNDTWGIQLQGGSEPTSYARHLYFYDNEFSGANADPPNTGSAWGTGVRFNGYTENVVFDSNQIIDNDGSGVAFTGSPGVNAIEFHNNLIANNAGNAVDPYPGTDFAFEGNTVYGNGSNFPPVTKGFEDNLAPVIELISPASAMVGQPLDFGFVFSDDGYADHALWDFGVGLPVAEMTPEFTFDAPGEYRITLVVWDDGGRADLDQVFLTVVEGIPGDYNADGTVDAADYTVWRDNLGGSDDLNGNGDETGDSAGVVDLADYDLWRSNYGVTLLETTSSYGTAAPEPNSVVLCMCAVATAGGAARRRSGTMALIT